VDPYPLGDRIDGVVTMRSREAPNATAVRQGSDRMSYARLAERAATVAGRLREVGVAPGSFVPTIMDYSPDLIAILLGIMRAGCAYVCLDPWWPADRLRDVIEQSKARVVIGDETRPAQTPARALLQPERGMSELQPQGIGTDAACVFFTSGSSGRPKGVVVPHRGLVRAVVGNPYLPFDRQTVHLVASPLPWDGFAHEVWGPLLNGGCCVLRASGPGPLDASALRGYLREGVNSLLLPSPLFTILAEEEVDLFRDVKLLVVAGDRLSIRAARRVMRRFPRLELVNGYGPAENSLITAAHVVRSQDLAETATDVPIGKPVPLTSVALIDESGALARPGETGELVTGGDGVALEYLGNPAETAQRFFTVTTGSMRPGRYYRTGDLASLDADGLLHYRGRIDRQVKLNGIRIEPGEVEAVIESHRQITGCAVTIVETVPGRAQLACAYTTVDGDPVEEEQVRQSAGQRLLATMVPAIICHVDRLPVGDTGKVDIAAIQDLIATRLAEPGRSSDPGPSRDSLLTEIRALLGRPALTYQDDLLGAGMTSLDAVRLAARLGTRFGTDVTAVDIFRLRTVEAIRTHTAGRRPRIQSPVLVKASASGDARLTSAQRRQLFAEWAYPGDMDNMIVEVYLISGPLQIDVLESAIRRTVMQHRSLSTIFPLSNAEPVARALSEEDIGSPLTEVPAVGLTGLSPDEGAQQFAEQSWTSGQFLLDREIPLRARVCRLDGDRSLFSLHMHHIAVDGRSEQVLLRAVMSAYADVLAGRAAAPPPCTSYADFAEWEHENVERWVADGIDYWRSALADPPAPFLPEPKGRAQARCRTVVRTIDSQAIAQLTRAAARRGGPPVSALLAATALALGRTFTVNDLCLGTVTSGRLDPAFDDVVGLFINPLAVPVREVLGEPGALLAAVADRVLSALDHAATPFDELVRILRPPRERHPWFQALAILQEARPQGDFIKGITVTPLRTYQPLTSREWMLQAFPRFDGCWDLVASGRSDGLDEITFLDIAQGLQHSVGELARLD
jgi:mycobactin peptide synthetase MbtE